MAKKKKRPSEILSDRALFDLVAEYESNKERANKYENDKRVGWRPIQAKIVQELRRRKVKSLTGSDHVKVTLVAPETLVYKEDDLYADLTPAQRKLAYDRQINLSKLPKDVQAALLKHLTPAQRKSVVSHKLNVDRLSNAVQDEKISVETVSEHSEIQESAGYIRVSRGETT